LNVVIEGEHLIAVSSENGTCVNAREIFPLKNCRGKNFLDGSDENVDEVIVVGPSDAIVAPAEIFGIAKAFLVVGADIEHNGKRACGMNAADEAIERKFANRNA